MPRTVVTLERARGDLLLREARRQLLDRWDPDARPVHCANCAHARVEGDPDDPCVRCAAGQGGDRRLSLYSLIRPRTPACFRRADQCPGFTSLSGEE